MNPQARVEKKATSILAVNHDRRLSFEDAYSRRLALGERLTESELSSGRLRAYSTETNRKLLDGLSDLSFYTYGMEPFLSMQRRVFEELATRGAVTQYDQMDLFKGYLAARDFGEARAIRFRFPELELPDIPVIVDMAGSAGTIHRAYDVSVDSRTARLLHLPIEIGPRIVVAALNGCPVATKALQSLSTAPDLARPLESHGIVLTIRFDPDGIAPRNATSSGPRMYIAYKKDDWPGIDFYLSPTIYFLKDGEVLRKIAGWNSDKSIQEFRRGLESIGLGGT